MLKSRGMAVIGAFVLIALAILVRGLLVDGSGDGGSEPSKRPSGEAPVVACTPELSMVCAALADAGAIASDPPELDLADASDPPEDIDGWITWNPAPQVANFDAGQAPIWGRPISFGRATLAALMDPATQDALIAACDEVTVWACIGQAPAADLTVGVGEPTTAEGLARLAPIALALTPDRDTSQIPTGDLIDLVDGPSSQADAATMSRSATQAGVISIVVGPEDILGRAAQTNQGKDRKLQVAVATPDTKATVVLAPRAGREDDVDLACQDLPDDATAALRSAGVEPCTGTVDDALAGFLYQVEKKVG